MLNFYRANSTVPGTGRQCGNNQVTIAAVNISLSRQSLFTLSPAGDRAPLRLRHLEVERGWGKGARLRVSEHPQGLALRLSPSHATWPSKPAF